MNFKNLCEHLTAKIKNSYENGVTMQEAEKLAGEYLYGQLQVSGELRKADLDARTKKSGTKAVKAACYMNAVGSADKKPTEAMLTSILDSDETVGVQQGLLDKAEVEKAELERIYDIFREAHIHFRGIAKGSFGG